MKPDDCKHAKYQKGIPEPKSMGHPSVYNPADAPGWICENPSECEDDECPLSEYFVRFGTSHGMRGSFSMMYDKDGPIQTGMTAKNYEQARKDAIAWAKAEYGDDWQRHCDFKED